VSDEAKAALTDLQKTNPDNSLADAHKYIATGRAIVKKYPETLGLKDAVSHDIRTLDFSLDGLQKRTQIKESAAVLDSVLKDIASRPTDDTLAVIANARKSSDLTPGVVEKFRQIESEIGLLRQAQAESLKRYDADRKANRELEAVAEANFLMSLQQACLFGPTPEYQALAGADPARALTFAVADLHTAREEYEAILGRVTADPKKAATDLNNLLKQHPGTLEKGRIAKILEAIDEFGQ
ncbi:MAG TPA: hypothetical protein VL860_02160, partial [Planctomycetota bacterium]|nr:hypothetical protein [Planctomycetota bacterium]